MNPLALAMLAVSLLAAQAWAAPAPDGQQPVWYPAAEPSPFIPDAARWIGGEVVRIIYFRGTWRIKAPVRRAVLMAAPSQTVDLYVNGRLALSAYDEREALPAWREMAGRLQPGDVFVAARTYSEWRPALYSQMRVEYQDGSVEDLATGPAWQAAREPAADWATNPQAGGDWRPAADLGGYHRKEGEGLWGHDFALLPREMLRARMEAHNQRLRDSWPADQKDPGLGLSGAPEDARWAAQFRDFCRLDETGQLLDGAGQVRHLFFTIYGQDTLSFPDMDMDQFERDLDLMARADVHLYMRNLGWCWLLTRDGEWAPLAKQPKGTGLPHFARGIDLLDHLVRRAYAHGRYVVFEGDFYWAAHSDVVPAPYRSRYHIYPEVLEAQALATRKIMRHFAECRNVLGMMIGEEDIGLAHDLSNPHQHALFTDYLHRKYGTLEEFRRQTPRAVAYDEPPASWKQSRKADYWPGLPAEEVLAPRYAARAGVFDGVRGWPGIPLPYWPGYRSPAAPEVTLAGFRSYNDFTPEDPLWIDFYEMREDELLFDMLKRWAEIVRPAMPRQLLFYSNAQDFTNSWHFLHLYRRADLPFDVIGVGCHDSGFDLADLPPWATVRKGIKVISSYRPYVLAPGSPSRGVAPGEGEGGKPEHPEAVRDYYRSMLFDEIGGGCAWTQTYTWAHISGRHGGQMPHITPLLEWMADFMPAVQGVAFPLRRPVQVLVVRNANLQHSNMSGLDYGNTQAVAETLSQLNVESDIVMDRDLCYGRKPLKVDLAPYRLVILPSVSIDVCDGAFRGLDQWLSDPKQRGKRVLALGRIGLRGPRLQPEDAFCPMLQRWLGRSGYARTVELRGPQSVVGSWGGEVVGGAAAPPHDLTTSLPERLALNFGQVPPTGVLEGGTPLLQAADGATIAAAYPYAANRVCAFGFPLGFAHENLWGGEAPQEPRDAVAPLYEALMNAAGVDRPILAPHNLRVYVSERGKMILIRERAGLKSDAEVAVRVPAGVRYPGTSLTRKPDGYARFRVGLAPWEGKWWKARGE